MDEQKLKSSSKRKKTKKDIILDILLAVFILIAIFSGAYLARYYYITKSTEKKVSNLRGMLEEDESDGGVETATVTVRTQDEVEEKTILKKFESLYESNNDLIGWITIDGTIIDYPVMYTPDDPQYYLHMDYEEAWSMPGLPFADARCSVTEDRSDNIIIYGHNMQSGIMFHTLLEYENEDYYKEHKYIKFDTLYETGTYEIIGAARTQIYPEDDTENFHYYDFIDAGSEKKFQEYIDYVKGNMSYDTGVTAEYGDELITLSTCAYHVKNGRFIVLAKKVDAEQ